MRAVLILGAAVVVLGGVLGCALVLLSVPVAHFLAVHLGLSSATSSWYLWWSGFGGDLGLFGAVIVFISQRRCEVNRCWRIGRHVTAAGHHVCRRHHPDDALTVKAVEAAHRVAQDQSTQ